MADRKRPYLTARKRVWIDPDGTRTPGVGLMRGADVHAHLTPVEARTLADRLHDLADAAGNPEPKLPTTEAERE